MASNVLTTSLSVSFSSSSSTASNVFHLEEYQPKARIDGALPALQDPLYRYAAVYGNHLGTGGTGYTLDGYNCSARYISPGSVSNVEEAEVTKIEEQIIVFSGEDSYDASVPGLAQVLEVEQISKFYQIQGTDVIDTAVTLSYDGVNKRIAATPKANWYGVARIKYVAKGDLYLVTLDLNRPEGEKMILTGTSFYFSEEAGEIQPVVAYIEFSSDTNQAASRNEISLEEYSPSETSAYYQYVSSTKKLVDLYVDHLPYTMEASQGVVFELVSLNGGKFSYTDSSVTSFTDAASFTGGAVGSTSASFKALILFDSSHKKIDPSEVSFSWDKDSLTFTPSPAGTYTGVGVVSSSRTGYRYKVDISQAPSMDFKDKEGTVESKKLAVLTASNEYTNPDTKEVLYGFAEISLDVGSASSAEGDNLLQIEVVSKDDLRAGHIYLDYNQVLVMVYADHPYKHFIRHGVASAVGTPGQEETQFTEITLNGESSADFKQAGLVESSVLLDIIIMINKDGSTADVRASYNQASRKIVVEPAGEYYGVIEVSYKRRGDGYKATLSPYDANNDGRMDGFQSWFMAYSVWKDPDTKQSYTTFVTTKLSTTTDPQFDLNNQVSIEKYEKALGKQDSPRSRREQFYRVRAAFDAQIDPVNCSLRNKYTQSMKERTVVSVSGGNSISVGPGLLNYNLTAISAILDETGQSAGWSGGAYDYATQQIYIGGENDKFYGIFFLEAEYTETIVELELSPDITDIQDRSYVRSPDHIGALVVHDVRYNPVSGEPVMAYAFTEITSERDEKETDGDAPGKGQEEFHFLIEEDPSAPPVVNERIKRVCYFLNVYPCPEGSLGSGFAGGLGEEGSIVLTGDSHFKMGMTYLFNPVEGKYQFDTGVPYKKTAYVDSSSFVNNTSKITLTYPPTGAVTASLSRGSKMLDVFGVDWSGRIKICVPGEKYKSLSWRKVLDGGYMVPETGGLNASYNTVGPYELVICVSFSSATLGEFWAEIPLIGSVDYQYSTTFARIAAFWDPDSSVKNTSEVDAYYGFEKVFNILGTWNWFGKRNLATGTHSISKKSNTQQTTKGVVQTLPESQV